MTTSLFLVGFAVGAPILAPLSEGFERLPIYVVSMLLSSILQIGTASSTNMASLEICRFCWRFRNNTFIKFRRQYSLYVAI